MQSNERQSLYGEVTARIIAELEQGRFPWVQPWDAARCPCTMPRNAVSARAYTPHVHNLAFLRTQAERLDARLTHVWPGDNRKQRGMFEKLKEAYVNGTCPEAAFTQPTPTHISRSLIRGCRSRHAQRREIAGQHSLDQ